jgi:hemerythrin-like domain-containing protein
MNQVPSPKPATVLREEHQLILRVVRVLTTIMDAFEREGNFPAASLEKCMVFIRLFADACHHGKEEESLFPMLEARGIPREGGPIGMMLHEHRLGREFASQMAKALDESRMGHKDASQRFLEAARRYCDLLTNHIFKEDNVLFNLGDRVMTPDDQQTVASQFCAVNCRLFEGKRRESLRQMVAELEAESG